MPNQSNFTSLASFMFSGEINRKVNLYSSVKLDKKKIPEEKNS